MDTDSERNSQAELKHLFQKATYNKRFDLGISNNTLNKTAWEDNLYSFKMQTDVRWSYDTHLKEKVQLLYENFFFHLLYYELFVTPFREDFSGDTTLSGWIQFKWQLVYTALTLACVLKEVSLGDLQPKIESSSSP